MKKLIVLIAGILCVCILPSCGKQGAKMTSVGTPRNETLIVDILNGRAQNPKLFNPYQPGVCMDNGYHQLALDLLWEINTTTGRQFPSLAAKMPEPLDKDYTKFLITLKEGIYWSDGVEFTSDDVAYTFNMVANTPKFAISSFVKDIVKGVKVTGKYTLEIETNRPTPRLSKIFGVTIWGNTFRIVPKHVWETKDVATFDFYPPVTIGQYKLKSVDENGYWFLWERRDDWQRTSVGQTIKEEPAAKYVLFKAYGTEEKRILAMAQNEIDILQDITPEGWDILKGQNTNVKAWYESFPYADMDDPCERGIELNNSIKPYDDWRVRWALVLSTDIEKASFSTFAGMLRVSPLQVAPIHVLMETYHKPMIPWLKEFTLPDGYKPFDSEVSIRIAEKLRKEGVKGIPENRDEIIDLFGVGWWKYDPKEAESLLTSAGFKRNSSGKWLLPDGKIWELSINAPASFEIESQRVAFTAADIWRNFGITVNVRQLESGGFWTAQSLGDYQAGSYWPNAAIGPDIYETNRNWHKKYIVPNGKSAPGNFSRYPSDKISGLLDALSGITEDDPKSIELTKDLLKAFVEEMPWIPMFGTSKFVPVNETYWTNYPNAKNYYEGPWWWWSTFKYIIPKIKPKQN